MGVCVWCVECVCVCGVLGVCVCVCVQGAMLVCLRVRVGGAGLVVRSPGRLWTVLLQKTVVPTDWRRRSPGSLSALVASFPSVQGRVPSVSVLFLLCTQRLQGGQQWRTRCCRCRTRSFPCSGASTRPPRALLCGGRSSSPPRALITPAGGLPWEASWVSCSAAPPRTASPSFQEPLGILPCSDVSSVSSEL